MPDFNLADSFSLTPDVNHALRPAPWGIGDIVKGVGLAAGVFMLFQAIALAVILIKHVNPYSEVGLGSSLVATLIFESCLFVLAARFSLGKYHFSLVGFGFHRFRLDQSYLPIVGIVGGFAILIVYQEIISVLHLSALQPKPNLPAEAFKFRALIPLLGVEACLIAPVVEECFFRGFVFRGLLRKTPPFAGGSAGTGFWVAAIASGALFAAFHLEPGLFIPFTCVGALFAWLYWRSGSLWSDILAHAGFNLISFAASMFVGH